MNIQDNTTMLFVVTSKDVVEERFFSDIAYFIEKLNGKVNDVTIITNEDAATIVSKYIQLSNAIFIKETEALSTIERINSENLFVFVNCHGSLQDGIDCSQNLRPYPLTCAIKKSRAKNIIVMLCQCFAGMYSNVDLNCENKSIVYIGATGLHSSISMNIPQLQINWSANISLIAVAIWLANPIDVDGDGVFSVIDLFMFLSTFTNEITHFIEKQNNKSLAESIFSYYQTTQTQSLPVVYKLANEYMPNYFVPHQFTWIKKNCNPAKLIFEDLI